MKVETVLVLIVSLFLVLSQFGPIGISFATDESEIKDSNNVEVVRFIDVASDSEQKTIVADVVNIPISEDKTIRVGVTSTAINTKYSSGSAESGLSISSSEEVKELEVKEVISLVDEVKEEIKAEESARAAAELKAKSYSETQTQGGLLDIANHDSSYTKRIVNITGKDRDILERLVQGEAGNQGFIGAALVAQAIKDLYIAGGFDSIESVRVNCGFSASLKGAPNQNVKDAVAYVFDQGGYAVQHRLFYFYAPKYSAGRFHETQNHILTYGGHKFFDRWY